MTSVKYNIFAVFKCLHDNGSHQESGGRQRAAEGVHPVCGKAR